MLECPGKTWTAEELPLLSGEESGGVGRGGEGRRRKGRERGGEGKGGVRREEWKGRSGKGGVGRASLSCHTLFLHKLMLHNRPQNQSIMCARLEKEGQGGEGGYLAIDCAREGTLAFIHSCSSPAMYVHPWCVLCLLAHTGDHTAEQIAKSVCQLNTVRASDSSPATGRMVVD